MIKLEKLFFYLLIFCLPLQVRHLFYSASASFNEWQSIWFYATDGLILLLLGFWIWRLNKKRATAGRVKINWQQPEFWLGIFVLLIGLSAGLAENRILAGYGSLKLLEFVGLFLYVKYNFLDLFSWKIFWRLFSASALLQAAVAIGQFFSQKSLGLKFLAESPLAPDLAGVAKIAVGGAKIIRAYGLVPHPNILAAILVVAIFGFLWLLIKYGEYLNLRRRIINELFLVILLFALWVTFSRGIIVVGLAALGGWLWFFVGESLVQKKIARYLVVGIIGVFIIFSLMAWPYAASHFNLSNFSVSQSVGLRGFYNQAALVFIGQSPWLGLGPNNFVVTLAEKFSGQLEPWAWQPVHNLYLLLGSELGLLALLAFLAFLSLTIKSAWPRRRDLEISYLLFTIGYLLIIGLFDHFLWDLQQGQILFWLMLGLLASFSLSDQSELSPRS